MRLGDVRIFKDPEKVEEMVRLRDAGWSWPRLATKYNCDHTSLIYQFRKFKKLPKGPTRAPGVRKVRIKEKACPKCELLLRSEFFCEYCKDSLEKKHNETAK
jgi:hypothetical protein